MVNDGTHGLDAPRLARALALLESGAGGFVEGYFERVEEVEISPDADGPGVRVLREEGFALRQHRDEKTWIASRDGVDEVQLGAAFRQVARAAPPTAPVFRDVGFAPWEDVVACEEMLDFPSRLQRALRERRVGFPMRLRLRRHRRTVVVVGPHLHPEPDEECYYSLEVDLPGTPGAFGCLLADLEAAADGVAPLLVERFRAREAPPPAAEEGIVVLAPAAAAVLLHEAVAHALEVDTLALSGDPSAAIGLELAPPHVDLLDDPAGGPVGTRRKHDDEGVPVVRRWLLRQGQVEQPLADRVWAERHSGLVPGAGRRQSRHHPPSPRSHNLELLPGAASSEELLAGEDGGLLIGELHSGQLDPLRGRFFAEAPCARRLGSGELGERVGGCRLEGRVSDLLQRIVAVGEKVEAGGAGWCAKGGQRLPVWGSAATLRIEGLRVEPR